MNNALEFKLDSQLGSIEPGKIANRAVEKIVAGKRRRL
jgi:hypothetical protein